MTPLLGPLDRPYLVDLLHHLRWRAAVEGPLEAADRAGHRRREVASRGDDDPRGEGRGVEPVLRADDEVGIERSGRAGIGLLARELVQEARDQVE